MVERLKSMKFKVQGKGYTYYARFQEDAYGWITVKLYDYNWFGKQINKGCEHVAHKFSGRENLIADAVWKYQINNKKVGA